MFDALYLIQNTLNIINDSYKYFVVRLKDENRLIYKDAKGLFDHNKSNYQYEIVEHVIVKDIRYSKNAKRKSMVKTKRKKEKRNITNTKLGEK